MGTKEDMVWCPLFVRGGAQKNLPLKQRTGRAADRKGEEGMENFKVIDNYLMIRMPEEIDHHKSSYISENADRFIVREKVDHVVFDFENTKFMDSSGIGIILGRYKKIACFGGKVFAINADDRIRHLLMISGLHKIVEIME